MTYTATIRVSGHTLKYTHGKEISTFAHSDNVDDNGDKKWDYDNNLTVDTTKNTVTVENAQKLKVTLKYNTEEKYDFVYVYANDEEKYKLSGAGTEEFEIEGNSVTFVLSSDTSGASYGYFATICGILPDVQTISTDLIWGDVDLNGSVTDKDAAMVLKYISTGKPFFEDDADKNAKALTAANADGKGKVDMLDVIKILQVAKENKNA